MTRRLQRWKVTKKRDRELALQLGRFWSKTRKVSGRSGMVERERQLSGPGDDLLGSPAVVWHTYTMSHHHLLSLVAMATTLAKYRHCCNLQPRMQRQWDANS